MGESPLRILHLTAASEAGGLSRYILDLGTAMTAAGHAVAVAGARGAWHDRFDTAPFPWLDAPLNGGPLDLWRSAHTLSDWLDRHPADLLHVHYRRAALVGRLVQRRHSIPMLYTLHLSDIPVRGPRRWLSDFGDHTHAAAAEAQAWLVDEARVPPGRITVIPHGVDHARFPVVTEASRAAARGALGLSPTAIVAAYVGRLDAPKNEDWLLDLAAASRPSLPGLVVLLAGDGPHAPAVRDRLARDGLGDRVRLLGHRDPLPVYHAADALLLPSEREGFSLACAEAMSAGLPVLRTRTAGTAALVVEGVTGRSTAINRGAFLGAAVPFLADRDSLHTMGRRAAAHVREGLTFDRQLRATVALYRALDRAGRQSRESAQTAPTRGKT